jgi:putative copper export protein
MRRPSSWPLRKTGDRRRGDAKPRDNPPMSVDDTIRWIHLVAAAVWVGGQITVAALVPALRKAGATTDQVRTAARRFGVVAWTAIGVSVATGVIQLIRLDYPTRGNTPLLIKLVLVGLAVVVAWVHQIVARSAPPALRGAMEGTLLVLALAILAAAVAL